MKISSESNHIVATPRAQTSAAASTNTASFSEVLATTADESSGAKQADFTSMTRQEMFDWMNEQIRSGKMTFDESSPFLGMTMKISVATGEPVDMATDTEQINFVEKARMGIEGAYSRNDPDLAKRLQAAIDVMRRNQGVALLGARG